MIIQLILRKFIYDKFILENVTDFTLNEKFQSIISKIDNLKKVINSLENEKEKVKNKSDNKDGISR